MENLLNNVNTKDEFEEVEGYVPCEALAERCMFDCIWPFPDPVLTEND